MMRAALVLILAAGLAEAAPAPSTTAPNGMPFCTELDSDPDGDGWGWNARDVKTCLVRHGSKDRFSPPQAGCQVGAVVHRFCSADTGAWSWEQGRACVSRSYCPAHRAPAEGLAEDLANPKAEGSAQALYDWLRSIYGRKTLAGQQLQTDVGAADMLERIERDTRVIVRCPCKGILDSVASVVERGSPDSCLCPLDGTGLQPALVGFDFINYTRPKRYKTGYQQTEAAIDYWRRGGLVTFAWHWRDPTRIANAADDYKSGVAAAVIPIDAAGKFDAASDVGRAMAADVAVIAAELERLRRAGVVVLWRPLHEAAGGWFWWGRKREDVPPAYAYVQAWRWLYRELTERYGLNNLIWVWNGQDPAWYPGDEFVDVSSFDHYATGGNSDPRADIQKQLSVGVTQPKMFALSEVGTMPDPAKMSGEKPLWFMTWFDLGAHDADRATNFYSAPRHNPIEHRRSVYRHPNVITLKDVPGRF